MRIIDMYPVQNWYLMTTEKDTIYFEKLIGVGMLENYAGIMNLIPVTAETLKTQEFITLRDDQEIIYSEEDPNYEHQTKESML